MFNDINLMKHYNDIINIIKTFVVYLLFIHSILYIYTVVVLVADPAFIRSCMVALNVTVTASVSIVVRLVEKGAHPQTDTQLSPYQS